MAPGKYRASMFLCGWNEYLHNISFKMMIIQEIIAKTKQMDSVHGILYVTGQEMNVQVDAISIAIAALLQREQVIEDTWLAASG